MLSIFVRDNSYSDQNPSYLEYPLRKSLFIIKVKTPGPMEFYRTLFSKSLSFVYDYLFQLRFFLVSSAIYFYKLYSIFCPMICSLCDWFHWNGLLEIKTIFLKRLKIGCMTFKVLFI